MKDLSRTNRELLKENSDLKQRIQELEHSESERKRDSEGLRETEEYFKAITQNSSDIILIVDKLGTITYASPSTERFLGWGIFYDNAVVDACLRLFREKDFQFAET